MILYLLFSYLLGESMAANETMSVGGTDFSKKVMCYIKGNLMESSTDLANLEAKNIPCECEVIMYSRFSINEFSIINIDEALLKSVTDLNKPVILTISREQLYLDWIKILKPDGNAKDTKVLCDFALKHNVQGYILNSITPQCIFRSFNENVGKYIIPYIKQLKQCGPDLIIGVTVEAIPSSIKNPCMYNFEELNDLVDFYEVQTFKLNECVPNLYNGRTPITKSEHGANYLYGMEEVALYLKESKICLTKLTYNIEMYPVYNDQTSYTSYKKVCKGEFDCSTYCVQTTKNFYDKGKFLHDQNSGIIVMILDLDDINNDCDCTSAFIGFKNIIAGFTGGSHIPCAKFDIQSIEYSIK
ncbi:uncharacterized protein LOC132930904 [Rhopalosiphum padi]|uniref:uncharacterized protein LOC132930904 n=1 Tax=Rhopalosiphum padi TaxID=40932 RepID=UPI00298DEE30|nr:uncharacterized protein LOC132930904 [Rhopalosiphum padi]